MSVAGNGKEDAPRPDVREDGQEQSCTCGVILRTIEGALRDNRWQPLGTAYDEPPSCPVHSARPYELRPREPVWKNVPPLEDFMARIGMPLDGEHEQDGEDDRQAAIDEALRAMRNSEYVNGGITEREAWQTVLRVLGPFETHLKMAGPAQDGDTEETT